MVPGGRIPNFSPTLPRQSQPQPASQSLSPSPVSAHQPFARPDSSDHAAMRASASVSMAPRRAPDGGGGGWYDGSMQAAAMVRGGRRQARDEEAAGNGVHVAPGRDVAAAGAGAEAGEGESPASDSVGEGGGGGGDACGVVVALVPEQDDSFHEEIDAEERMRAREQEEERAWARQMQLSPSNMSPLGTPGSVVSDFDASGDGEEEEAGA